MTIARINGIDVFYKLDGNPEKPAIIFSNSLGTYHTMWDGQIQKLENDFFIIRYDTRGHGQTSAPRGPYSLEILANDVLALLDFLDIKKVIFCGISMGGLIGQYLGINATSRISKLVIANTSAKIGTSQAWFDRAELVRKTGLASIADSAPSRWFTPEFYGQALKLVNSLVVRIKNSNPEGYASCCDALAVADLTEKTSKVSVPTLIIAGKSDPVTTVNDAEFLLRSIEGSHLVELDASHISNIEAQFEFNSTLFNFIKK
jgi:3-oxoadipate enol-lactonase